MIDKISSIVGNNYDFSNHVPFIQDDGREKGRIMTEEDKYLFLMSCF